MPKNKGKGGKNRRRGKKDNDADTAHNPRELLFKEVSQEYAIIEKVLGNGRFTARILNGRNELARTADVDRKGKQARAAILAIVRGSMRRKVFVNKGDFVLLSLREFEDDKADIIHLYHQREVYRLIDLEELPSNAQSYRLGFSEDVRDDDDSKDIFGTDEGADDADDIVIDIGSI
ncbi:hypothetical protein GGS26DRAFT_590706 [Hypomontagnella submonticulosa]|nr:hypothetical protein GGS26DRAFT_590706 [Hypomontagnella submonticulosa]